MIYKRYKQDDISTKNTFRKLRDNIILVTKNDFTKELYLAPIGLNVKKYDQLEKNNEIILSKGPKGFLSKIKINSNFATEENNLIYKAAYNQDEYIAALQLINEEHYLPAMPNGLFIILKNKQSNKILCCMVLSRLTYANPKRRKKYLSENEDIEITDDEKSRKFASENIIWISRVVTASGENNKGYAKKLCNKLPELLTAIMVNPPKYIEVMTSWGLEDFNRELKVNLTNIKLTNLPDNKGFWEKAGFKRILDFETSSDYRQDGGWKGKIKRKGRDEKSDVYRYYYVKEIT